MRFGVPGTVLAAFLICGCGQPSPETTPHSPKQYPDVRGSEPTAQEAQLHLLTATADTAPREPTTQPKSNWQYD